MQEEGWGHAYLNDWDWDKPFSVRSKAWFTSCASGTQEFLKSGLVTRVKILTS